MKIKNSDNPASELTKLEYALIHSTWEPFEEDVKYEVMKDRNKNQYNESHKPRIREAWEIVKELKIKHFTQLLDEK